MMKKRVGIERNPLGFTKDLGILDAVGVFRNPSFPFLVALGNWVYITFQRSFVSFTFAAAIYCDVINNPIKYIIFLFFEVKFEIAS